MQRKICRASRPFAVKTLTVLAVAAAFSHASAAGLGKLTVLSALGQPLRAEIELTSVSRDEADTLAAKLASVQAFKQANVEFNPALMSLRFAVEQRNSRQVIRITSSQPINEPYVGMLIELASSKGRLVREYTFLLDPPEFRQTQIASLPPAPVVTESPPVAQQAAPSEKPAASSEKGKPAPKAQKVAAKSKSAEDGEAGTSEYRVRKGDTLGLIAGRLKHDGVSLDQMLVSIYRANPDAFIGNNMNRLKSGKIMTIPDAAAAGGISQSEARRVIVAQSSDFEQYRNKLAESVAQAPVQQAEQSSQASGGKITAKVEEQPSAVTKSVDRLKLSKENAAASDKPAPVVSTEDKLSQDKSIADAQARIRELEKNIKELQGLLELRSKDLSAQQKQAEAAVKPAEAGAQAPAPAVAPPVAASQPQPQPQPPKPAAKPKAAPPPPPAPPPSFLDDLVGSPTVLGGIAAAVIGLAYLLWSRIRRKKLADEMTNKFMAEPMAESPNSLFGTTGGQSVNTNNSVFNSSFTPSAIQLDANEVDPVAEADVYIAYGREAQAIDILKDALRAQPERNAVRIKLLEIYAAQKDVLAFDTLASDLYALTKGEGEDWAYAAKMGASIDPKNPLYTDADVLEEIADKPVPLHSFTNPVEALDPDSLTAPSRISQEAAAPEPSDQVAEVKSAADDSVQWADLPLDIGSADAWPNTRPAEAEKPTAKLEMEDLLDWSLDTAKSNIAQEIKSGTPDFSPVQEASGDAAWEFENLAMPQSSQEKHSADMQLLSEDQVVVELAEEILPVVEKSVDLPAGAGQTEQPAPEIVLMEEEAVGVSIPEVQASNAPLPELQIENQLAANLASSNEAAPLEFDFASINLDLDTSDANDNRPPSFSDAISSVNIEMATKLDLAVAYMEIGDKEGARELLDEVIKGGSEEQVAKAKETLSRFK